MASGGARCVSAPSLCCPAEPIFWAVLFASPARPARLPRWPRVSFRLCPTDAPTWRAPHALTPARAHHSSRSLSNYNQELVACIEDLREKREELNRSLLRDEEEKAKIQKELTVLTERLSRLNEDLARKMQVRWGPRGRGGWTLLRGRAPIPSPSAFLTPPRNPQIGQARLEFDQTIQETEAAYMKILESSQTLLSVLKRESVNLTKRKTGTS